MSTQSKLNKLGSMMEQAKIDSVNIIVAKENHNLKPNIGFVMSFPKVTRTVIDNFKLTMSEYKTLLVIVEFMEYQNLMNLTQQTVAKELGISKQAVSKHFKKFFDTGIIFKDSEGSIWVNPVIFSKGKLRDVKNNQTLYKEVQNLSSNIGLEEPPF